MYKNLEEFLGSYFHQDWMEDASSSMGIVEKYLSEWPLDEASAALQELQSPSRGPKPGSQVPSWGQF